MELVLSNPLPTEHVRKRANSNRLKLTRSSKTLIEQSVSECATHVLFAPKKDGSLRFSVDYRNLNTMKIKDSYPLPWMEDCIDSLGEAKAFKSLEDYNSYWKVSIAPQNRHKASFVCHAGIYQYIKMILGLTNTPPTLQ